MIEAEEILTQGKVVVLTIGWVSYIKYVTYDSGVSLKGQTRRKAIEPKAQKMKRGFSAVMVRVSAAMPARR